MQRDVSGAWISADGQWRWDGQAWLSTTLARSVWAPLSFGDVISLPTRDPRWLGKCGIEGLISLIPVYGNFEILGWSLTYLDGLRAGRLELPKARFGYAGRGAPVTLVGLIYWLSGIALFGIVFAGVAYLVLAFAPPTSTAASGNPTRPFPALWLGGLFAFPGVIFLLYALTYFLVVPIMIRTERHGLAAGLNLLAAVRMATEDLWMAAAAAALVFLSGFIAGLGIYACLVGVVFSYGYGAAMLGATVHWYEERRPAVQA